MIHDLTINNKNNVSGGISICECGADYSRSKHAVLNIETCYEICCIRGTQFTIGENLYHCNQKSLDALRSIRKAEVREALMEALMGAFKDMIKEKISLISGGLSSLFNINSK